MYYVYTIQCIDLSITDTYVGITRDLDMTRSFHCDCSLDGLSYLYVFIRSYGGWLNWKLKIFSSHDTLEEARNNKVFGSLNVYDTISIPTIYKICCKDLSISDQYIGQTINFDNRRFSHFLSSFYKTNKLYDFIRDHGGWSNWKMSIIKQYPHCNDKYELSRLEHYWWKTLGGLLNSNKPGSFKENYRGSDEEFEECISLNNIRGDNFTIKEISLDI